MTKNQALGIYAPLRLRWLLPLMMVGGGCSDNATPAGEADGGVNDGGNVVTTPLSLTTTSAQGMASVGDDPMGTGVLVIDAITQRAVAGVRVHALPQRGGYLVRASLDENAFEPEVTFIAQGARKVIEFELRTAALRSRVVRPDIALLDQDWLATTDIAGVAAQAEAQSCQSVVFLPESADPSATATFHVYRSTLPNTLVAVLAESAQRPGNGTVVSGVGRVVSVAGARQAAGPVGAEAFVAARVGRAVAVQWPPSVAQLRATPTGAPGGLLLQWDLADPQQSLLALDVGINTLEAQQRLAPAAREHAITLANGEHFACVRPVFAGSEADGQVQCVSFTVQNGATAPNLRVQVRRLSTEPVMARGGIPVEVSVQNVGEAPAAAFDVGVLVSSDGRPGGGLGDLRTVEFRGLAAGAMATRRTQVAAAYDGSLFLVAEVDPKRKLQEANQQDNLAREAVTVAPRGAPAPVLSLAVPQRGMRATAGQPVTLTAVARDPQDGDISSRIVWTSSVDGEIGRGGTLVTSTLSPGVHRVRASVIRPQVNASRLLSDHPKQQSSPRLRAPLPLHAAAADEVTEIVAEVEVTISTPDTFFNTPPAVFAGPDVVTTLGVAAIPQATAFDAEGQTLTISWQAFDASGAAVAANLGTTLSPSFLPSTPGRHRLRLSVSDGLTVAHDEVQILVLDASSNTAPSLQATAPSSGLVGQAITVTVSATDAESDPLTFSYALTRPEGSQAVLQEVGVADAAFTPDVVGTYKVDVTAYDGRGGRTTSSGLIDISSAQGGGLLAHFTLDATSGSAVADSSGKSNNGVVVAGNVATSPEVATPTWTMGAKAGALSLDGVGQHVRVSSSESLNTMATSQAFSVAAWVNLRAYIPGGETSIVSRQADGTALEQMGLLINDGYPTARVHLFSVASPTRVAVNSWVHIAMTYDGTNLSLYVNGMPSSNMDIGWAMVPDVTPIFLGASQKGSVVGSHANAAFDDVRIYARQLAASEVALLAR